jgi:aminoglycoside 6'-N-acetyltransferase I
MESIVTAARIHLEELTYMGIDLWPDNKYEELKKEFGRIIDSDKYLILLYLMDDKPVAFLYVSVRTDYVEGTKSSPTGFIEGVYVKSGQRRKGISKKLLVEGEKWLKEKGCKQIGSDIEMENQDSYYFHKGTGFTEAARLIAFIKDIK